MTNWLIVLPLITIACIAGFYQLFTISTINFSGTQNIPSNIPNANNQNIGMGTSGYINPTNNDAIISVEMTSGIVALIIGTAVVGVIAGIKLFSSGLSETSVRLIYRSTLYYGLWGIFSALAYPFFLVFPLFLGIFGWFILTLVYSLGYFEGV